MFNLWKRVEKLEKEAIQRNCLHYYEEFIVQMRHGPGTKKITVMAACRSCDKEVERVGHGEVLENAENILRCFLENKLCPEPEKKKKD